jgi:phospholipase/lecithinase/hemolysin
MRSTICVVAALAFCACSSAAVAKAAPAAKAAFQLNETSWTYTDKGMKVRESIDADGNYIENAVSGKHIDHGTAVMKDDKVCFTSAMTKDGEMCWTTQPVKIGHSMNTVSDKGTKLKVTRVAYAKLSMPK